MNAAASEWTVQPHAAIETLADNLWRVEGPVPGLQLTRVMTLARLEDGRVVVHSAMALDDTSMARIDAWGNVAVIVVPSRFHRLDAPRYAQRYPNARIVCPAGAREHVSKVTRVDATYDDVGDLGAVRLEHLDGLKQREGVMWVRSSDGLTVVFNDVIFNAPHADGFAGWMMRYVTASTGGPRVSRVSRLVLVADRKAFAAHLRRIADTEGLRRAIVAHHRTIDAPREALMSVALSVE